MSLSIPLTDEELVTLEAYAKLHSLTTTELVKKAVFERIEDECDVLLGMQSYEECQAHPEQVAPMNDLYKDFDVKS